ncbi:hypothetical protein NDU88_003220 [Pleurodeles waltl]|uniref:Uncharacterized protein n=1 Tax=Pleurodeles waltl TaxID=8319 RepID=A0AAV7Q8D4_PLEWA|nr:hypothetical protein NDU88_003220 [Pleurodeles waltl]
MSETLHCFSFCRVSVHHFFSLQESDASIRSALSGPGRPSVVFTRPAVLESEIQLHDDLKNMHRRLQFYQPPSAMLCIVSPAPGVDLRSRFRRVSISSREAGGASIFQPQIGVTLIFSPYDVRCEDFFLLSCQLLFIGSQELDGHHLAE